MTNYEYDDDEDNNIEMANREKTSSYQNNHYHMTNLEQMKNMMIMKIMTGRVEKRVNSPSSS